MREGLNLHSSRRFRGDYGERRGLVFFLTAEFAEKCRGGR